MPRGIWNKLSQIKLMALGAEKKRINPIRKIPNSLTEDQKTIDYISYYKGHNIIIRKILLKPFRILWRDLDLLMLNIINHYLEREY